MIRPTRLALLAGCSLLVAACTTVKAITPHFGGQRPPAPSAQQAQPQPEAKPKKVKAPKPPKPAKAPKPPKPVKPPKPPHSKAAKATPVPLAQPSAAVAASVATPVGVAAPPPRVWPQIYAPDLPPDPAMRFGTLPNGMRYAIMRNATPGGQASLRLRIDAGSINETDDQQGLAHLLEHMAFNGSTHVPRGEMINILERHGLAFGADTNASTSWETTVYKLDLPKADQSGVDDSLMLLREVASELTLAQTAINQEKGVVLSEERLRDTPSYRVLKDSLGFDLTGQIAAQRFPIGQVAVIQNATHDQLAAFYNAYYRPDRATLIAVGDFDPDAMEAQIKARFGDWAARAPAAADPDRGSPLQRGPAVRLLVQPGAGEMLQMAWAAKPDLSPDSTTRRRRETIQQLGLAVLNRRLDAQTRSDEPPFISAGAYRSQQFHSARLTVLQANSEPGQWEKALGAIDQDQRQLLAYGVSAGELSNEIDVMRAALKIGADSQATRTTPSIAEDINNTLNTPEVETSPAQDLALFDEAVKGLTPETVNAALKDLFSGSGPLVFLSSDTSPEGGEAALTKAFATAEAVQVQAPAAQAALTWPYTDFGPSGVVAQRTELPDIDTVFVRFQNGVRLTVRPSKFRDNQILVSVRVGDGMRGLPPNRPTTAWAASSAFPEAGLDQLSAQDTDQVLRSAIVGREFSVDEQAFVLGGSTRADDLDTQLQLLAAYTVHAGWRTAAFQRMHDAAPTLLSQMSATPAGVLGRELGELIHSGDRRWAIPTAAEIASQTPADLKTLLQAQLAGGPIEVVIVGDTGVDTAIQAVADTFGALPARAERPAPNLTPSVRFPAPTSTPIAITHNGRADQAIGLIAWPTSDFLSNTQQARTLSLLGDVIKMRLTDKIRRDEGLTYSPGAASAPSEDFAGYGYISARVEIPPQRLAGFFSDVQTIAGDLRKTEISADELARIKTPAVADLEKRRQTNEYWLNALSDAQADPRRIAAIRTSEAQLQHVSADDIKKAAQTFLDPARAWELEVTPKSGAH